MIDGLKEVSGKLVPENVREKMVELRHIETSLGHLPPENWAMNDLHRKVNDPQFPLHANQLEQTTETLFGDVCDDLHGLGFTPAEIAQVVNSWLNYAGGPKYCDESEVVDALSY